ncbi:penicillin-binding protein activator [Salinimonas marina]|uniref:Penicillin-binding protein activator n=1 Tax=Salinimonas marina TaxID=2785918 RepID=A0A7S9DYE6_9ALTE|nr:penicillin-binding protein activator [Salinimonas marina]QPG06239.1 penicillin-binding protein activator [Salinimonas marina]
MGSDKLGVKRVILVKKGSGVHQASYYYLIVKCVLLGGVLSLAACSSGPSAPRPAPVSQPETVGTETPVTMSPQALIAKARQVWEQQSDKDARDTLLLDAATAYLQQQQPRQARQLLLTLKNSRLGREQQVRANTLIAQSYMNSAQAEAGPLIDLLLPLDNEAGLKARQLRILTTLYERQNDYLAAANSLLQYMQPNAHTVAQIWRWVNKAEPDRSATTEYPDLQPYIALRNLVVQHGLNTNELSTHLQQFRQVYRGQPVVTYMPEAITQAASLSIDELDTAAVLLPLSGRFAATGALIKQGILAGYYQQLNRDSQRHAGQLRFIDTNNKSAEQIISEVGSTRWVIGPLLKDTIEAVAPRFSSDTRLLALNRIALPAHRALPESALALIPDNLQVNQLLPDRAAFFALAPEDEAYQLAEQIFSQGHRAPIIVAADGGIYQRLLDAFSMRWQQLSKNADLARERELDIVRYTDSKSLKEGISASLGVAQSKNRIDQIRYMVNEKLYNVTRNRRDIDAIVVFASAEQTELLNPMIEASLSPFDGKTVPVYATSRSMEYDSSKNQWRDLQNVRFIDMPWLMPDSQWQSLKQETAALWPRRSTAQARFFAFGVDAYQLLPFVETLSLLPQINYSGLTGTLSGSHTGELQRLLPQAIIDNGRIKPLSEAR